MQCLLDGTIIKVKNMSFKYHPNFSYYNLKLFSLINDELFKTKNKQNLSAETPTNFKSCELLLEANHTVIYQKLE